MKVEVSEDPRPNAHGSIRAKDRPANASRRPVTADETGISGPLRVEDASEAPSTWRLGFGIHSPVRHDPEPGLKLPGGTDGNGLDGTA